jgi:ABC-2 type transport system ATP-binding protein
MVEALRGQGTTVIYTTHYMEEAERLCDTIAIVDHGHVIAQGSKEQLVAQSFGGRSDVLMHFASTVENAAAWTAALGGTMQEGAVGVAHFAVSKPTDIGPLLDAAIRDGLEVIDVVLRRPNLESVFLQLTGRELRQ